MTYTNFPRSSIAIIGMACVYPGAHSPEELWENVLAGRRFFRKMPPERLPRDYFDVDPTAPGKSYCDLAAVITNWTFDPVAFRIPPVTVEASDVAHWLALSTAKAAIENAKLRLDALDRTRIGVVLGNTLTGEFSRSHNLRFRWPYMERAVRRVLARSTYDATQADALVAAVQQIYEAPLPEITEDSLAGNMSNTIAGRICNYFDLGAGGYTIDGACSSSLLAVETACNALLDGDMDIALAGGVDVSLDPFEIVGFAKTRALAVNDIRPYDERAAGMLTGEGCGLVILMKEEDARAAGYPIHALIRGWGYSSDGSGGITAPEVEGQARALRRAYERAGYTISTVGLIEGHGTGTAVGDKVEISAIRCLLEASPGDEICWLGSIKANIGHCKAAAGAAGLIKAVMALKRKILPPTVNCERPTPVFGKPLGRLRPNLQGKPWSSGATPRRASVSSMGFGGANSHLTLEEANLQDTPSQEDLALLGSHQKSELILLAANSRQELQQRVNELIPIAERICRAELTDLAATLTQLLPSGTIRLALVIDSPWELAAMLRTVAQKFSDNKAMVAVNDPAAGIFAGATTGTPTLVMLFPGQGSQRLNMGEHLPHRYPFIRDLYAQADRAIADVLPHGLRPAIFRDLLTADEATRSGWEAELRHTLVAQPAIVLSSLAMLRLLNFFGLKPTLTIGHSLGEISALCAAGACDMVTAVRTAALRGQAMAGLQLEDLGTMAAITAPPDTVEKLLAPFGTALTISNYNSPRQTVVSGTSDAIRALLQLCAEQQVGCRQLPVSHAFHSDIVAPAAVAFREALDRVSFQALSGTVISTATGQEIIKDTNYRTLLGNHIRQPVRFTDAVLQAAQQRPTLWIEVGPGGILTGLVRDILGTSTVECLPTDLAGEDSFHLLNVVLARAFVQGFPLALDRLFAHRFYRPFSLDNYNPIFIVNPCERPVKEPTIILQPGVGTLPAALLPAEVSQSGLAEYLAERGPFLRDFIALDYRHYTGNGAANELTAPLALTAKPVQATEPAREEANADKESLLTFAIEWIARRTGYPTASISPEMRLRDDLNLDSIKAGELVLILGRKLKREVSADSGVFANARLDALIEAFLETQDEPPARQQSKGRSDVLFSPIESLDNWVRTFRMASIAAPLEDDLPLPLPDDGIALIVAESGCQRAQAIAKHLSEKGLAPIVQSIETLQAPSLLPNNDALSDLANLALLVVVLPEAEKPFLDCTPAEFDDRVEGLAEKLFHLFRRVGHGRQASWSALRCLILRPYGRSADILSASRLEAGATDDGADLDAGRAFLQSLRLEYPGVQTKWVRVPEAWSVEQWATVALQELQTANDRVAFSYGTDGLRMTEVACPLPGSATILVAPENAGETPTLPACKLGVGDVVLVTGGAKGITCELALALARQTGVSLALLGSSPLPDTQADPQKHEILRNLQRLTQEGIRHRYVQCDVTELEAVQKAGHYVEPELGPVTAILHGAGVSQLHLFRDMDLEICLRCIRVKARGLYNLLTVVPPQRLKAVHVTSSVLGKTGMQGQADYTFANAWLDGALSEIATAYPHVHCVSLGYSVWSEVGLGKKLGTLDSLALRGVATIDTRDGVAAYLNLLQHPQASSTFVITGRLTPDLEVNLFPPVSGIRGRFLERVLRWIPSTEIVAEATVSHETDFYVPEHAFEGTPLFPGVMAIEAIVEAAMACAGREDPPVLQNIEFRRPLIIPEDASITMRILALADAFQDDTLRIRVAIRSDTDNFQENHFTAECVFCLEMPQATDLPTLPQVPEPLAQDPENFSPVPLFQGKFFRRITAIRTLRMAQESLTDIQVPDGARYYNSHYEQSTLTPYPVARDAFLQSGALILPPGCLPERVQEIRFHRPMPAGTRLLCQVTVSEKAEGEFLADFSVFTSAGEPVETIRGCLLRAPKVGERISAKPSVTPIPFSRLGSDLRALLPKVPLTLAVVNHEELQNLDDLSEISKADIERIRVNTSVPRQQSVFANLVATRRAALAFACQHRNLDFPPTQISVAYRADGKPELRFDAASIARAFSGIDVSLADDTDISIALIGPAPVGVDIEIVETRDAETWRGLLGDDGYALALRLATATAEPFDRAATRV
ncbi:MAG: SDR family NAD(P)-dependent oxidoreductase, partial [Deltaproteobacteria bacterium]|nr:SDR family NAD(P)-dependent oxidoreductase [Deltaproteobacteria bacterium]